MQILKIMYNEKKFYLSTYVKKKKNVHVIYKIRSIFVAISVHMKKPKKLVL